MDVSSASAAVGQQVLQSNVQASLQMMQQMMQQELALVTAMAGGDGAALAASPPPGVGTVLDVTA